MSPFVFAYEFKFEDRYPPNGLQKDSIYFQRWVKKENEYNNSDCGSPLKRIMLSTQVQIQDSTVEKCILDKKKFIYPIEILRTNRAWLDPKHYAEHSPWPAITEETKQALRSHQATLLLTHLKWQSDDAVGDPMQFKIFEKLHATLNHFKIPAFAVVYVGASPELPDLYKQFLAAHPDIIALKSVETINYLEKGWQIFYDFYKSNGEIYDLFSSKNDLNRVRTKKFICFNLEPRVHRKLNISWLFNQNLLKENLVSFYGKNQLLKFTKENPLPKDPQFSELIASYESLTPQFPLIVDAPEGLHFSHCRRWPFADTYYSFLTERVYNCSSGWTLQTPKVFKAICNIHPFIILGQQGYLKSLHDSGYKTFSPFKDESYDFIVDPIARTKAVWKEVLRLNSMSLEQMHSWYYSMLPILEFNFKNFLLRSNNSQYDEFVLKLGTLVEH